MHDRIKVFTKDKFELVSCNNARARLLVKKKKASFIFLNRERCLMLNKTKEEVGILKNKDQL